MFGFKDPAVHSSDLDVEDAKVDLNLKTRTRQMWALSLSRSRQIAIKAHRNKENYPCLLESLIEINHNRTMRFGNQCSSACCTSMKHL